MQHGPAWLTAWLFWTTGCVAVCTVLRAGFLIPTIRAKYSLLLQIKVSNHLSALPLSFPFSSPKHGVFSWSICTAHEDTELAPGGERLEQSGLVGLLSVCAPGCPLMLLLGFWHYHVHCAQACCLASILCFICAV